MVDTFAPQTPAIFADKWPTYRGLLDGAGSQHDANAEQIDLDKSCAEVLAAPSFRPMPVAVLSKTEPFQGLPAKLPAGFTAQDIESRWPLVRWRSSGSSRKHRRSWPPAATTTSR